MSPTHLICFCIDHAKIKLVWISARRFALQRLDAILFGVERLKDKKKTRRE
jgi:hypothetical protein